MESLVPPASPSPSSFAGFLAALAQPERSAEWNDELLREDVASLSYERALRTHARYHADDPVDDREESAQAAPADVLASQPAAVLSVPSAPEKSLKEASITIRLSREEDAQLRKRAAEAGLTVSAYIRSCTFEAESLRALVKDTLTQFRTGAAPAQQQINTPNPRRRWSALFWPGRRAAHTASPNQA
jgi:predicted DNA binding CopG/RHH family protein